MTGLFFCISSSNVRASRRQREGCGFKSRLMLNALVAQPERVPGYEPGDEGSTPSRCSGKVCSSWFVVTKRASDKR